MYRYPQVLENENYFELIKEAINELLTPEFGDYENLGISSLSLERVRITVIAVFAGIVIACFLAVFNRRVYGNFVRSVTHDGCFSPESAKTLGQLGYLRNTAVRSAIKNGNVYKGVVRCPEQDDYNAAVERRRGEYEANAAASGEKTSPFRPVPFKFDFNTARFYVPEEFAYSAEVKFEKKGTGLPFAIIVAIVSAFALWCVLKILPDIFQLMDNFIGMMSD